MPPFYEFIVIALLVIIVASRFYHQGYTIGYQSCQNDHKEFIERIKKAAKNMMDKAFTMGQYEAMEGMLKEMEKQGEENEQRNG